MVTVIATTSFVYAERSLSAGDAFEASEKDAALLKKVGRAVDPPPKRSYRTRDTQAEEAQTADVSKRTYRRRDLEPEP